MLESEGWDCKDEEGEDLGSVTEGRGGRFVLGASGWGQASMDAIKKTRVEQTGQPTMQVDDRVNGAMLSGYGEGFETCSESRWERRCARTSGWHARDEEEVRVVSSRGWADMPRSKMPTADEEQNLTV
eukprot:768595-Hanusia_phi.AAC.1